MKNFIKKAMYPIFAISTGLLFVILSALTYVNSCDGYFICRFYQYYQFLGFTLSFFQFFHIISFVLLIGIGIMGILEKTGVIEFKKALPGWDYKKLVKVLLIVMASLGLAVLMFSAIVAGTQHVYIGFGSIFNAVLECMVVALYFILDNMGILDGTYEKPEKVEPEAVEEQPIEETEVQQEPAVEEPVVEEQPVEEPQDEDDKDSEPWL